MAFYTARSLPQIIAMALLTITVILFISMSFRTIPVKSPSKFSFTNSGSSIFSKKSSITNSTLGFEKIYAVNLPSRGDKRDALALMAAYTNFTITFSPAVTGADVPDKALPPNVVRIKQTPEERKKLPKKFLKESEIGSWRAHMNAVRDVVENGYGSALIMEDDADWDIRLKEQLPRFAEGSRYVLDNPGDTSPYGDDWDILWLGHCRDGLVSNLKEFQDMDHNDPFYQKMNRVFAIPNDETMPPPNQTLGAQNAPHDPYTRLVHRSSGPICTFAYAVSQQGARKILYNLAIDRLGGAYDNALADLCRGGKTPDSKTTVCISSSPPLFFHHRPKGSTAKDSDIRLNNGATERKLGFTGNIVNSARLNLERLSIGLSPESQFKDGNMAYPPPEPY